MAKSKKSSRKPTVKVQDLEPEADPKGGAEQFIKFSANKAYSKIETALNKGMTTGIKDATTTSILDSSLKFHK